MKWCLDNSITSQLTTPVSVQDLGSALFSALESSAVIQVTEPSDVPYEILLAEDNYVNQKLAVKILQTYGHNVAIAENGEVAVNSYKASVLDGKPFDVILVCSERSFPHISPNLHIS